MHPWMHLAMNVDEIKKGIEEVGHTVTTFKKHGTKIPLHIFYVELKLENNNKDIYKIRYLLDCSVKFELSHPK